MIIQASNGCYLTEAFEVAIKDRRFVKSINLSGMEEAALWKEVTELEMKQMIEEGKLFEPEHISYSFLQKLELLKQKIPDMINNTALSADEALTMTKYYPKWEDKLGYEAETGYRVQYQGILVEVVTPHVLSAEINPSQQPMLLNSISNAIESVEGNGPLTEAGLGTELKSENVNIPTVYFKIVESERTTLEEPAS